MEARAITRRDISRILDASFPTYKGRKFRLDVCKSVCFHDLNWSGGSRNQYALVRLSDLSGGCAAELNSPAPWNNPTEGASVPMSAGFVVVRHSMFCGKDTGITVHAHPDDIAKILPAADSAPAGLPAAGGSVRINTELNGVEVSFPSKPDRTKLDVLKSLGFRWSMSSRVWYKRRDPEGAVERAARAIVAGNIPAGFDRPGPDRFDMAYEDSCQAITGA